MAGASLSHLAHEQRVVLLVGGGRGREVLGQPPEELLVLSGLAVRHVKGGMLKNGRKRVQLILTSKKRFVMVNPAKMEMKGEIWMAPLPSSRPSSRLSKNRARDQELHRHF